MGLRIPIIIFFIILLALNLIVFSFVRGIDFVDEFTRTVLGLAKSYFPGYDPTFVVVIFILAAIVVLCLLVLKMTGKSWKDLR